MEDMELYRSIKEFLGTIGNREIEIYNEFSVQHELGLLLRQRINGRKVQFERNVDYFGLDKRDFIKKEIDLSVFTPDKAIKSAIELKFPTNGQYPEQMFSFAKDIRFLEQLKASSFKDNYFIAFANDPNFWKSQFGEGAIYRPFCGGEKLEGRVVKPTGKKDKEFTLEGSYDIKWKDLSSGMRYFSIEV